MVADLKVGQGVGMLIIGGMGRFQCMWCLNQLLDCISATLVQRNDGEREEYGRLVFVQAKVHLFDRGCSCTGGAHMKVGLS